MKTIWIDRQNKKNNWRLRVVDGKDVTAIYLESKKECRRVAEFAEKLISKGK